MQDEVLADILEWSKGRLGWQRDALRRIFSAGPLTAADFDDLADLCKAAHGLSPSRTADVLAEKHLAITGAAETPVRLISVTHHRGVNALAPEQMVSFGEHLTIVYGQNATGKSGYTRILKRACRSRSTEGILGNVLSGHAPLTPQATIRFHDGTKEVSHAWTSNASPAAQLAAVSVFDAQSAPVYLRDKTDVAFRPFGLDVFDRLSVACAEVRKRLEDEQRKLAVSTAVLPSLPEGTKAKALVDTLTGLTKVDEVRVLVTLLPEEQHRLKDLQEQRRDVMVANPKQRARELSLKADRIALIERHVATLAEVFADARLKALCSAAESLDKSRTALITLRKTALTPDLLPGTGEDAWRRMWDAAEAFSKTALGAAGIATDARCPFCQQKIQADATERLKHLREYITSNAQIEVRKAEAAYETQMARVIQTATTRPDLDVAIAELSSDEPDLGERVRAFLEEAARVKQEIATAHSEGLISSARGVNQNTSPDLAAFETALRDRVTQLQGTAPALEPEVVTELKELESRDTLSQHLQVVEDEIERKKRVAAYGQSIDDTVTQPITRKSTELTKKLVTDHLCKTFQAELDNVDFTHLAIEIQPAGGTRGSLFHHLVFSSAPEVPLTRVLSEGESRTLSLVAFLTELSTATSKSAIIFDDPVSSLDHIWRERIARRLVKEASSRQVIVFTHDLLFLRLLINESERQGVACQHQYVRRNGEAGVCSSDLPWIAMGVRERIGVLRTRWQASEKLSRTASSSEYESDTREIYGLLREAWEQAVSEILLNKVVERFRHSIETQRVRVLHDITPGDCQAIEKGMTECSRWIRGHDAPQADAAPFPKPAELKKHIDDLDSWAQAIAKRRDS